MTIHEKLDLILRKLETVEARLPAHSEPEKLSLTREEAMALAGYRADEVSAWFLFCSRLRLKPYRRKHYRRQDVIEALARASFRTRKPKR